MKWLTVLIAFTLWEVIYSPAQTVTDFDGNLYDTVIIGNQVWFRQNLRVTHYSNGDPIPNIPGGASWNSLTSGARCYYNNDSTAFDSVYGALYNWYAVQNSNEICPVGWRVPSDADWTIAENFLEGSFVAGGKMKEADTAHWLPPNTGATNSSGFTGLPGGMLGVNYTFETLHENGLWWSSTSSGGSYAWSRYLWYLFTGIDRNPTPKTLALSIRCIRDIGVGSRKDINERIKLYPNPARKTITLKLSSDLLCQMMLFNTSGETLYQWNLTGKQTVMDISRLPEGIYFIRFVWDSGTVMIKLVKE